MKKKRQKNSNKKRKAEIGHIIEWIFWITLCIIIVYAIKTVLTKIFK